MMLDSSLKQALLEELGLIIGRDVEFSEDLLVEGGLDSFGIMQVVVFLEERFGVMLPDDALVTDNFSSVEKIHGWAKEFLPDDPA
jgi:acyl carrier protein